MTLRTVTVPTELGEPWDNLEWPGKSPADRLRYTLDAAKWLRDAGEAIQRVAVFCSAGLMLLDVGFNQGDTEIVLHISGGTPDTVAAVVLKLTLTGNDELNVQVALPIFADVPVGLVVAWPPVLNPTTADSDGRTADSSALTADAAPVGPSSSVVMHTADAFLATADAPVPTADAA